MPKKRSSLPPGAPRVAAVAVLAAAATFAVLNLGYLSARLSFRVHGPATVTFVPPAPQHPDDEAAAPEPPRMDPDRLIIASLGIDVPIVYVETRSEAAFQLGLRDGVVHYPGTAIPGQPGNAFIFGHSSDYVWAKGSYKTVFAVLPDIKVGDRITASDREGRAFTFVVTGTRVVSPKELSVLDQGDGTRTLLTLQTSYPLGTALKRFIVDAELVAE